MVSQVHLTKESQLLRDRKKLVTEKIFLELGSNVVSKEELDAIVG